MRRSLASPRAAKIKRPSTNWPLLLKSPTRRSETDRYGARMHGSKARIYLMKITYHWLQPRHSLTYLTSWTSSYSPVDSMTIWTSMGRLTRRHPPNGALRLLVNIFPASIRDQVSNMYGTSRIPHLQPRRKTFWA